MSPATQVLYELAAELRDMVGIEEQSNSDNPADTFFGNPSQGSDTESQNSKHDEDISLDELCNITLDEQDF